MPPPCQIVSADCIERFASRLLSNPNSLQVRHARRNELKFKGCRVIKPTSRTKTELTPEGLFGRAILASPVAVLITTPARHIIAANAAAAGLLGNDIAKINGLACRQLYAIEEDWSASQEHLAKSTSPNIGAAISTTLQRATGEMFDTHITLLPSFDSSGQLSGVIEIIVPASARFTPAPPHLPIIT
jgi:hypothetical protein